MPRAASSRPTKPRLVDSETATRCGVNPSATESARLCDRTIGTFAFIDATSARTSGVTWWPSAGRAAIVSSDVISRVYCCSSGRYTYGTARPSRRLLDLMSPTTPTIVNDSGGLGPRGPKRWRTIDLPTAVSPGQSCRAARSSTIATAGAPARSAAVKSRPARIGIRSVEK